MAVALGDEEFGDFQGAGEELGEGDDFVHKAEPEHLLRADGAGGEEQVHGVDVGYLAGEAGERAAVGDAAEARLVQGEGGVWGGEPDVRAEHHAGAHGEGVAVDRRDHGFPDIDALHVGLHV